MSSSTVGYDTHRLTHYENKQRPCFAAFFYVKRVSSLFCLWTKMAAASVAGFIFTAALLCMGCLFYFGVTSELFYPRMRGGRAA